VTLPCSATSAEYKSYVHSDCLISLIGISRADCDSDVTDDIPGRSARIRGTLCAMGCRLRLINSAQ
jgi:hypothetical protein